MIYQTTSKSVAATLKLGEKIGRNLKGQEVIELASDLGGGKTLLVKGIAKGLGYKGQITSPTFTICRIYPIPKRRELHHFDFYRLSPNDIVASELKDVAGLPRTITVIEWADHIGLVTPAITLKITLDITGSSQRAIAIESLQSSADHIIKELKR